MATFFQDVEKFFDDLWEKTLKPAAERALGMATDFFSAAAHEAAEQLGETGLKIITDAVTAAEQAGGSGDQKWDAAIMKVNEDLATAGISAASHVINAALEAAVSQMNAAKAKQFVADVDAPEEPAAASAGINVVS